MGVLRHDERLLDDDALGRRFIEGKQELSLFEVVEPDLLQAPDPVEAGSHKEVVVSHGWLQEPLKI